LNLLGSDPTTLDPAVSTETTSAGYIMQIYSGLLKLDDNMEPVPDIAAEMPEVSADGLTYTFKLRKDVKFHDGKEVTAADFKYSWERASDPATRSQTAPTYLGDIVGVYEMLLSQADEISGVKVIDDYTLQVTIDTPKSYFLYKMTYPTTFVVEESNVRKGSDWWYNPVGTGPFKLAQWVETQSLTLVRNDNYYGEKAKLQEVDYQFYSGLSIDLYETGEIDVAGVSTIYKDKVFDPAGPFYADTLVSSSLGVYYIGFNCAKPPFDDPDIRKAFAMAVDKDKIISLIYRDMVQKADGLLPPDMPGYNENISGLSYNVEKAKELIASSSYGSAANLPEITFTTYGYGGSIGSAVEAMIYQWKENLGIEVKVRQLEPEYYFYNTGTEIDNLFDMGWSADYPHPQDFLDILFSTGSGYNYGGYSSAEFDSLIRQGNTTLDDQESFNYYQQAEQILVNEAGFIPLTFSMDYILVKPYVNGYKINALGFAELNKVSIVK